MRSLHPADAVHKGFGTIPTSILQRKNGVCIYERPACWYNVIDETKIVSSKTVIWLYRFPKHSNIEALKALLSQYEGKVKCIYIVILTPILMSILSSENAVRLNFIIHIMFLALFEMMNYNVLCGGAKWTI